MKERRKCTRRTTSNYVEEEACDAMFTEDDQDEEQMIVALAESGDEDAVFVTEYEDHVLELIQELPEMAECFSAYTQARQRLRDRAKNRGFWPGRGKGKGGKGSGKKGRSFTPRRSLADRIASSSCRICGKRGHWKWECPQRNNSNDGAGSSQDVSNFATHDDSHKMETDDYIDVVEMIPEETMTLEQMMESEMMARTSATDLISMQHFCELTFFGQHEYLDDRKPIGPHASGADKPNRLVQLCLRWGKLRDDGIKCEWACLADQVESAILDTGASKTVVGKENLKRAISQLDPELRQRIRTSKSQTVFRFGNNGTLPSLFTAWVPFGKNQWFRIEVVEGRTPFLISNAFMRLLKCELDFARDVLRIPKWQKSLKLRVNGKGLYQVDLKELLSSVTEFAGLSEVSESERRQSEQSDPWNLTAKRLGPSDPSGLPETPEPKALRFIKNVLTGRDPRHGVAVPGGRDLEHLRGQPRTADASSGGKRSSTLGPVHLGGRQTQRAQLPGSLLGRSRVREVYRQPQVEADVEEPRVLPGLRESNGDHEVPCDLRTQKQPDALVNGIRTDDRDGDINHPEHERGNDARESDALLAKHVKVGEQLGEKECRPPELGDDRQCSEQRGRPDGPGTGNRAPDTDRYSVQGTESGRREAGIGPSEGSHPAKQDGTLSEAELQDIMLALERASQEIETHLCHEFLEAENKRSETGNDMMTFLQIDVGLDDNVGAFVEAYGGQKWKVHISRLDLKRSAYQHRLRKSIEKSRPRHVWLNVGIKNLGATERTELSCLCRYLYDEQVSWGNHFHVWTAEDFQPTDKEAHHEVWMGTIPTRHQHCGQKLAPKLFGNSFLRANRSFRTTSYVAHTCLDNRHCDHTASGRTGKVDGLARSVAKYVAKRKLDRPMLLEELCMVNHAKGLEEAEAKQVLKRRRLTFKQSNPQRDDGEAYEKTTETWETIFKSLEARVPRVGNHMINETDELIQRMQALVPNMRIHHAEACRGINRLRRPTKLEDPHLISHRQTVVLNRNTNKVEEVGSIEEWSRLPRYKQIRAGKPARIALTMFGRIITEPTGTEPNRDPQGISLETSMSEPPQGATDETKDSSPQAGPTDKLLSESQEPKMAWGPPPVANHGPGFLQLTPQERAEIRQIHHNLGHPDSQKFAKYLKQGGACDAIIKGAPLVHS